MTTLEEAVIFFKLSFKIFSFNKHPDLQTFLFIIILLGLGKKIKVVK